MVGPSKGTEAEVRATGLRAGRLGEAAALLASCLHDNPNFVGLFPDRKKRSQALPRVFAAGLRSTKGMAQADRGEP
jgi:hypothetical protein